MHTDKQPRLISRYNAMQFVLNTEELIYFYKNVESDIASDLHANHLLLLGAFDWAATPQKHGYWGEIYTELILMENEGVFSRGK